MKRTPSRGQDPRQQPAARPSRLSRLLAPLAALAAVIGLQACTANAMLAGEEPSFGQSVRAALRAQEVPAPRSEEAQGVSFSEFENGLERYKAPATGGSAGGRAGGGTGSSMGGGAARPMLQ